jgi:rod shape-determining protein MreC
VLDFDGTRKARRREAALAGAALLVALLLVLLPAEYQRPIRQTLRSSILRPFLTAQSQFVQRSTRLVDVDELRAQRDSLAAIVVAQAGLSEENRQLRATLALAPRLEDRWVPANVLRVGLTTAESTFIVDIGSAAGVYEGSPVITADGLLGVVLEVDENSAQAIDWTHPDFRVHAMTADGEAYGVVEPRRGSYRDGDLLALTGAPFQVDVRPGRRVHSSGRGSVFPRGVFVGTVIGIEEADTGWRKSYLIQPGVRPESARQVLVSVRPGPEDLSEVWNVDVPPDTAAATVPPPPGGTP